MTRITPVRARVQDEAHPALPGQYRLDDDGLVWRIAGTWGDEDVLLMRDGRTRVAEASEVERWRLVDRDGAECRVLSACGSEARRWRP